jgi:hypothetical protein
LTRKVNRSSKDGRGGKGELGFSKEPELGGSERGRGRREFFLEFHKK